MLKENQHTQTWNMNVFIYKSKFKLIISWRLSSKNVGHEILCGIIAIVSSFRKRISNGNPFVLWLSSPSPLHAQFDYRNICTAPALLLCWHVTHATLKTSFLGWITSQKPKSIPNFQLENQLANVKCPFIVSQTPLETSALKEESWGPEGCGNSRDRSILWIIQLSSYESAFSCRNIRKW